MTDAVGRALLELFGAPVFASAAAKVLGLSLGELVRQDRRGQLPTSRLVLGCRAWSLADLLRFRWERRPSPVLVRRAGEWTPRRKRGRPRKARAVVAA